jgi:peptide-methionine (S)-S-oxide reductase
MRKLSLYLLAVLVMGCASAQDKPGDHDFVSVPAPRAGEAVATWGGGCFWAMSEAMSELKGVNKVIAGYAGGNTKNPTYDEVCTRTTNHAETVQVYYDPKVISYANLVKAFFSAHDPTTLNKQGPDIGTDYRSIVFYRTPEEKAAVEAAIKDVNDSKHYTHPVVTQVVPFKVFYGAERYHQGYYKAHIDDNPYVAEVSQAKVLKMRAAMKAYLKPEYQK